MRGKQERNNVQIPPRPVKHWLPLLLLSCHGYQEPPDAFSNEGRDEDASSPSVAPPELRNAIVDRVWVSTDKTDPPGEMRIFLSDGTLVSDSCWETYRLSRWHIEAGGIIVWHEDTAEIKAKILESNDATLKLRLDLIDGTKQATYTAASVPYVCPDMPK